MASNFTTGIPFTTVTTTNFTTTNSTLIQEGSSGIFVAIVGISTVVVLLVVLIASYCVIRARKTKPQEKQNTDPFDTFPPAAATFDTFDAETGNLSYSEASRTSGTDSVSSRRKPHGRESLGRSRDSLHSTARECSPQVSGKQNRPNRGARQDFPDDQSVASSAYSSESKRGRKLQLTEASTTQAYWKSSDDVTETTVQSLRPTRNGEGQDNEGYEPASGGGLGPVFVSASDYRKQQWERADSEDNLEKSRKKRRKRRTKNADPES